MAFGYGMHTDMPIHYLGEAVVQRCRKIWWTVHILDRQITSLMGNPQSIRDEDIHCRLPVFLGSPHRTAALDLHIKLVRIIAVINNSMSLHPFFYILSAPS
jgi:proline utilization trans-activator